MGAGASAKSQAGTEASAWFGNEERTAAETEAGDVKNALTEFQEKVEAMKNLITAQTLDLTKQIEHLSMENKAYYEEIASLKQQHKTMKEDALKEKEISQTKEAEYKNRINELESKIKDLEKQLNEKNEELHNARSDTEQLIEGAQAAKRTDRSGSTEHSSESPEIPVMSRDVSVTVNVHANDTNKNH